MFDHAGRRYKKLALALLIAPPAWWLSSCSAYTLGDAKPLYVEVNKVSPTWTNGVGDVLKFKCDNCHTKNPSKYVPANAKPYAWDFSENEERFINEYLSKAYRRIFETPNEPMPPPFGTPLTDDEKAALKLYMEQNKPTTLTCDATSTTLTWDATIPGTSLKISDAAKSTNVNEGCGMCHGAGSTTGGFDATTLANWKTKRIETYNAINGGTMPQGASNYKTSVIGKAMLEWLCKGADVAQ